MPAHHRDKGYGIHPIRPVGGKRFGLHFSLQKKTRVWAVPTGTARTRPDRTCAFQPSFTRIICQLWGGRLAVRVPLSMTDPLPVRGMTVFCAFSVLVARRLAWVMT